MKQIYDPHDVFCAATAEEARKYIGQEGYFADTRSEIDLRIKCGYKSRLDSVGDADCVCCFEYTLYDCTFNSILFLPACKIKNAEDSNE